jgi:hypothetical protein
MPLNEKGDTIKYAAYRQALIDNDKLKGLPTYKTAKELAALYGVPPAYAYQIRHRLVKQGVITRDKFISPREATKISHTTEELLKVLEEEPLLSALDRLKILSRLVRTGAPAIKIQAIKAMEELSRSTEKRVGPPQPLTEEDRIARLGRLMLGCGEETCERAWDVAFPSQPSEAETPIQPLGGGVPSPADPAKPSLPDL